MRKPSDLALEGFALLIVVSAVLITYRFTYSDFNDPMASPAVPAAKSASNGTGSAAERVTYRFLYSDEPGAVADRLTLARFIGGHLCRDITWQSMSVGHWRSWAPGIFHREIGWIAKDQPGWQISRWLCANESTEYDKDYLFWSIQALRFLDPDNTASKIDMIERSGKTAKIFLIQGRSNYDYVDDALYWNPAAAEYVPADKPLVGKCAKTDSLVDLTRQLSHMWHDLCQNGDNADDQERERITATAENRMSYILSLKDPSYSGVQTEPGY